MLDETAVWRLVDKDHGCAAASYGEPGGGPSRVALERQERLRCVGDTTRAAMEELSNVFGRAIDDIRLARSLVPAEDAEEQGMRPCCCDPWHGVMAGLSWCYAAHTSCLVRRAAGMLSQLAAAGEEAGDDTS